MMMTTEKQTAGIRMGFKFVQSDLRSKNGHEAPWVVGEWRKHEGALAMCEQGFHYCKDALDSLKYVYGDRWFMVEVRGEEQTEGNKTVACEMRLVREIPMKAVAVRFALACAGMVLDKFESKYPDDDRPRKAMEAAKAWLDNPTEANRSAAGSAARSAASAAESAAWSAESAVRSAAESASAESAAQQQSQQHGQQSQQSAAWSAAVSSVSSMVSSTASAWSAAVARQRKELARIIAEAIPA